jgi:tripartite-type tricarboxylate transporter receptor subunit TctC
MSRLTLAAALALALAVPLSHAQEQFPSRQINVVNPNSPGGMSDIISRAVTGSLQRSFKQPVITTSRVGAGGAVGAAYVANQPADGYTVLLNTVTHCLIPITDRVLGRPSAFQLDDFMLLARLTSDPLLFVVNPSVPAKTVEEFISYAKSKPGEVVFSSTGLYGSAHITMAMFMRAAGISLRHVPANGAGPAITAVLGNHAQTTHAPVGVATPHIKAGRVRLLAQSGEKRVAAFADTPTIKEAGYGAELALWVGFFAHAKTPPAAVKAWQAALREASQDADFKAALAKLNVTTDYLDGPALQAWYAGELKRLDAEVRAIGKIAGVK